MLAKPSDPVAVLLQWVKHFKAENNGRPPSEGDIPAELGPLWLQWIKSTRKVPLRISEGDCKRVEAHTITEHATLRSPPPAVSDAVRSHISETPVKSEGNHNEVECTSRPGGGYAQPTSPPSCTARSFQASPSRVGVQKKSHLTPIRTPSKRFVKRPRKHEVDAENVASNNQQAPQCVRREPFSQSARLLSPLKSPLRSPLRAVAAEISLQSPSNIRPGLMKRRMNFVGSLGAAQNSVGPPPAVNRAPAALQSTAAPAPQPASIPLGSAPGSTTPEQQQPSAQAPYRLQVETQKAPAGSGGKPVKRVLSALQSSSNPADQLIRPSLSVFGCSSFIQHPQQDARSAAASEQVPLRQVPTAAEEHVLASSKPAQSLPDRPGAQQVHQQQPVGGGCHGLLQQSRASLTEPLHGSLKGPATMDPDTETTAKARPAVATHPAAVINKAERKSTRAATRKLPAAPRPARAAKLAASKDTDVEAEVCEIVVQADDANEGSPGSSSPYSFEASSSDSEEEEAHSDSAASADKPRKQQTVAQLRARLKQLGLSAAGNKKDLQARLEQHTASCTAGPQQPAASTAQPVVAGASIKTAPNSKVPAGTGVFKAQKRKNFVRINLKGGGAQGKFRSKHGGKPKSKRFGRFGCFKPKALPQAGQGQDYVEGCNNKMHVCYKCGMPGHWARDCPGEPADGQDPKPVEEAANALAEDTLPRAVPAPDVLPEEAISEEALMAVLQATFGFSAFRRLQLLVIQSVLRSQTTFAIMPTGAGKSLCYQIPALLSGGLVLVVSPLIALMKDQLAHLPPGLPGAMLWSGQQASEALKTLAAIREGRVRVLYVAPERVGSGSLRNALAPLLPLPLVCVDEAHCISEWGHNFRSAYFRLGGLLREHVPSRAILALTATATRATEAQVAAALGVPPAGIFRDASLRANLRLHARHVNGGTEAGHTRKALLALLRPGGGLAGTGAVIAYATFQAQADHVAQFLTAHGIKAASYHAGKHMKERELVQGMFSKGQLRVVVATVAFGMGIDASFVRAVVHLSMPQSLEEYVQQVGRAGRDGQEAQCHLFLDDADFRRLHSLSNSDAVAQSSVQAFLEAGFQAAEDAGPRSDGDEEGGPQESLGVAVLAAQETSRTMDLKPEVMETLLSYLEAHEEGYVRVLPPVGQTAKVAFYSDTCDALAQRHPLLRSLLAVSKPRAGTYSVQMARWANTAGRLPAELLQELAGLAKQDVLRFELDYKPTLAFQVMREPEDLEALAKELTLRHTRVGRQRMQRLDTVYRTMAAAAKEASQQGQEASIRADVEAYFARAEGAPEAPGHGVGLPLSEKTGFLAKDVRMLLRDTGEKMSAQAVARVMHGISSAAYPAAEWRKCGYWGRYSDVDFARVLKIAEEEMK